MSRENKYRGKQINKEEWIVGFYVQLPKVSLGATIVADGDLCAEDVADYIIVNKSKQHPNFSNSYPLEIVECEQYEVYPDTVGQYIGKADRNGKEIYEGDIIRKIESYAILWKSAYSFYLIEWNDKECAFVARNTISNETFLLCELGEIEVFGNVYENADLLKEAGNE